MLATLTILASLALAAPNKIGPSAVFDPLMGEMGNIHDKCDKAEGSDALKACLLRCMKGDGTGDGVDPAAVAFTDKLDQPGFLREFIPKGKVDLGRVHFPWRANFNDTIYFLNGEPPIIDAYAVDAVLKFKGARDEFLFPDGYELPERAKTFTGIRYTQDIPFRRCRACEEAGRARVAWDFTDKGKFQRAKILKTLPPSKR